MKNLLILAYHRVLPTNRQTLAVTTDMFEKQIKYLLKKGYTFTTFKNLPEKPTKKTCIITFDDGYRDNYLYAWPILRKYKIPAVIYLATEYIGQEKPFYWDLKNQRSFTKEDFACNWDEIKTMSEAGIEFGAHSLNHYDLPQLSTDQIVREIAESKKIIEQNTGKKVLSFCFPRGAYRPSFDQYLRSAGYQYGVLTNYTQNSDLILPRAGIYGHDSFLTFKLKTSKLFYFLKKLISLYS